MICVTKLHDCERQFLRPKAGSLDDLPPLRHPSEVHFRSTTRLSLLGAAITILGGVNEDSAPTVHNGPRGVWREARSHQGAARYN